MANSALPDNATFEHLQGSAAKREEYLRRVVQNLEGSGPFRTEVAVRIGIAGKGVSPHYKFEGPIEYVLIEGQEEVRNTAHETFIIYNGISHRKMTAFELRDVRDEHWSSETMSYDQVRVIFGRVRAERKSKNTAN